MRRPGKEVKTQRRKTLRRRNAPKAARHREPFVVDAAERIVQLEHRLNEALAQQTATADVLKVISRSTFDLQTVLDTLLEFAVRLCEARRGALFRLEGNLLHVAAQHGFDDRRRKLLAAMYPMAPNRGHMSGRAVLAGAAIQIPDILADDEYRGENAKEAGFRSLLGVPLLRNGQAIGSIVIFRTEAGPFTDKQLELIQTFADQAVIAIENMRLLNELRQRTDDLSEALEQQTATSEVLKVISSSPGELETVFQTLLENATRICKAAFGSMLQREGDVFRRVALHNAPPAFAQFHDQTPTIQWREVSDLKRVVETKQVIHVADTAAEHPDAPIAKYAGGRTLLLVPMLKDKDLVGVIGIYRQEVRPFTAKQVELVQNFAAQAVIAIENTRLLTELRQRTDDLSESLDQQTATSEVLKVISSSPGELEPVFNAMLANATRICEATFGNLFLREGSNFRAVAVHGKERYVDHWKRDPLINLREHPLVPLARVTSTKQVLHIPDFRTDQAYTGKDSRIVPLVEVAGARSFVMVPMLKDDEIVGTIAMYRQEVRPFTDKQIELVQNFAAQAVIAIENARLLSELRESLQQQTATADVLKVISRSTFDLPTVLQTLVESAARLCDAEKATITREKNGAFYRAESYGFSSEYMDYIKNVPIEPDRSSISGRSLVEGRAVHVADVTNDPEHKLAEAQRLGDYRTALAVPMLREGVPIGVLSLVRNEVRPFSDKQVDLVTTFANQAAIAIENVRLFDEVQARTRELAKSLEDLRATQDRLVQTQKLASLGQLTAGIAHEIKNPLNFVNNFSGLSAELIEELQEALKDVSVNEKRRSEIVELMDTLRGNLDKIVQHGKRADAIVKNMLLHSREGSGEHRPVDINALVDEGLNLAYHGARAEKQSFNIKLEKSLDPNAGEADVFPQDITRVLLNLISNGFYAATKRGAETTGGDYEPTLAAATKDRGNCVEITIRDNGMGIPADVKEKMFNPFFTTKPAGEGTGLGLSISHDIVVKQHGGSIEVETRPGEFTEIKIVLPRAGVLPQ